MESQQEGTEKEMRRLTEQHREKMALFECQFLENKQQLLRGKYIHEIKLSLRER